MLETLHRPLLDCHRLSVAVPGRILVSELELSVSRGEFLAILGPNGVGKSISLHTIARLRDPESGNIELERNRHHEARPASNSPQAWRCCRNTPRTSFPATVFDTVMIGRHPHIGRFRWESDLDREIARQSLALMDLADLSDRDVLTLSGGERRRLAVAQVITQAPSLYLLDEPTNHLDPQHQLDVLRLFREKTAAGDAVIASLHDVNLAARFADRCLLLYGDGRWQAGDTAEVLTGDRLSELYGTPMESVPWRDSRLFVASG